MVDIAGPFMTKREGRNTRANPLLEGKVWALVVVCMASIDVNLDVLEGYGTIYFLQGFEAHVQVRGRPTKVIGDQGSQVISAADTVESLWDMIDVQRVMNYDPEHVQWEFVPSGSHTS